MSFIKKFMSSALDNMKSKTDKGFALADLVVGLSLSLVVASFIFSLLIIVLHVMQNNTAISRITSELAETEIKINNFFYSYDSENYDISVSEDKITFYSDDSELTLSSDELVEGSRQITSVAFEYSEEINMLKVTVVYKKSDESEGVYRFVLLRHSCGRAENYSS